MERGHLTSEAYEEMQRCERESINRIAEKLIEQRSELTMEEAASYVYADGGVK